MSNHTEHAAPAAQHTGIIGKIEKAVFAIRWLLVPLYVGLVAALGLYIAHFLHEVIDMAANFAENYEQQNILMLFILELLDMTLISQLVVMTIQGGYAIFIRPLDEAGFALPQWLKHGLGTSEQKIKMGMSIVNIMLVQLLKNFVEMKGFSQQDLWMREQMLACAIFGTLAFCVYNLMMHHPMLSRDHAPAKSHDNEGGNN
jgi:uncharacterized protein (TIGR00645 family)